MDNKENIDASEKLKEAMMGLSEKLDRQLNGDVVNDTFVKHIKKCVEKVVENHSMLDNMIKAGVPEDASEWMLFLFAVMSAGPIPEEMKTEEYKKGMDEFVREHDLVRKYEESKKEE